MATPHDALFKQIHSVPSEAAAELRHVLPRELADLVDWTTLELESGSFVDDLAQVSEDELRNRELSDTARVVLLCLQRARLSVDIFAELARWHDELQAIAGTPGGAGSLTAIVSYIMEVCGVPLARVGRFLRVHVDPEMKTEVMTMLDYMKEKFRAEGRADGRAELLLKQLAARFGAIPADVESRVRTASDALLDTWAERVLIAETLEQVLDD